MTYNRVVLQGYTTLLYGISIANAIACAVIGAVCGGVFGYLIGDTSIIVTGVVFGLLFGAFWGWITSFLLRVFAQTVLCQVEIETSARALRPMNCFQMASDFNSDRITDAEEGAERPERKPEQKTEHRPEQKPEQKGVSQMSLSPQEPADMSSVQPEIGFEEKAELTISSGAARQLEERQRIEQYWIERHRSMIGNAVLPSHFDQLINWFASAKKEISAMFPEAPESDSWNDFLDGLKRRRQQAANIIASADNEGLCHACRGRLAGYEQSEHLCSLCKLSAEEFEKDFEATDKAGALV